MSKKRVLVIEDDKSIRDAMRELLEVEGYVVSCAVNGLEGMSALKSDHPLPNLILLDMTMPIKDGFEFREEQRKDERLSQVPVLIMTADGNIEAKTVKVGAKNFIKKPFDIDEVLRSVDRYCS